jgi:TolB protein
LFFSPRVQATTFTQITFAAQQSEQVSQPSWSKDGLKILYVKGISSLWYVSPNGGIPVNIPITGPGSESVHPVWSPDGTKIAFRRYFSWPTYHICTIPATGGALTQITNIANENSWPSWSPDGSKIVFSSRYPGNLGDIYVVPSTGGSATLLYAGPYHDGVPAWSPDGLKIAFESNNKLWVMNSDGTNAKQLVFGSSVEYRPAWSSDNRWIAFTSDIAGNQDIWAISPEGGEPIQITNGPEQDCEPSWSPDNSKIAFCSRMNGGWQNIWVVSDFFLAQKPKIYAKFLKCGQKECAPGETPQEIPAVGARIKHFPKDGTAPHWESIVSDANGYADIPDLQKDDCILIEKLAYTKTSDRNSHKNIDGHDLSEYNIYLDTDEIQCTGEEEVVHYKVKAGEQNVYLKHTLIRYNLVIAFEWEPNQANVQNFKDGLKKASNYLYDVSDGQIYLDTLVILGGDHTRWADADFQILAKNDWRPSTRGGFPSELCFWGPSIFPRVWYENTETSAEYSSEVYDWTREDVRPYRTLIHELGHLQFCFFDEYVVKIENNCDFLTPTEERIQDYFGLMDYEASDINTEISYQQLYQSSNTDNNLYTQQWCTKKKSCWSVLEEKFEMGRPLVQNVITWLVSPNPVFATDVVLNRGTRCEGPNQASYDVSKEPGVSLNIVDKSPVPWGQSDIDVYVTGYVSGPPQLTLIKPGWFGEFLPKQRIEQGYTNSQGHIRCLGAELHDRVSVHIDNYECPIYSQEIVDPASAIYFTIEKCPRYVTPDLACTEALIDSYNETGTIRISSDMNISLANAGITYETSRNSSTISGLLSSDSTSVSFTFNAPSEDIGKMDFFIVAGSDTSIISSSFVTRALSSAQDEYIQLPDLEIFVPQGALLFQDKILVVQFDGTRISPIAESYFDLGGSFAISLGSESQNFASPVNVVVRYSPFSLRNLEEQTVSLFFWNEATRTWSKTNSVVDTASNTVLTSLSHFSVFSLFAKPKNTAKVSVSPLTWYNSWLGNNTRAVKCYIGNLTKGYEVSQIAPGSLLLNKSVPISGNNWRVLPSFPGFSGNVLEVEFDKYLAVQSLGNIISGSQYPIIVSGTFTDSTKFVATSMVTVCQSPSGVILGRVTDSTGVNQGITVDLFNSANELVRLASTNENGFYSFDSLEEGNYVVTIVTPLGFSSQAESKDAIISAGCSPPLDTVDFQITPLSIKPSQRSMGFWKHQVNAHLTGKGKPEVTLAQLSSYMNLIHTHFNNNLANPITNFQVPQPATQTDSLRVLQSLLTVNQGGTMNDRAKQQLIALLLNVVSGKISQTTFISEDSATVSQAITYCNQLITDNDETNDETAKDIADNINNGVIVGSGTIPLTTPNIMYKETGDQVIKTQVLPKEFSLSCNYPNPFNPRTQIDYALPKDCQIKLSIYNILGQKVKTLVDEFQTAGFKTVNWDGKDDKGQECASGIYFYKIQAGEFSQAKKMVIVK